MTTRCDISSGKTSRGAVLLASLLVLLIMTILALTVNQTMRSKQQDLSLALEENLVFQNAESALRHAERLLSDPLLHAPIPCSSGRCLVLERTHDTSTKKSLLLLAPVSRAVPTQGTLPESQRKSPFLVGTRFVVEEYEEVPDSLALSPAGPSSSRIYYRITAWSEARSGVPAVALQSIYARRFD